MRMFESGFPVPTNIRRTIPLAPLSGTPAFSLIELLVVVAVLMIITTLYFGFSSPIRQSSARKNCQANLQRIFLAQEIYARDHAGKYPVIVNARTSEEPLDLLVPRYSVDREVFICPGSKEARPPGESSRTNRTTYAYYMGRESRAGIAALMSDTQVNTSSKNPGDAIFSTSGLPPGNNHHQAGGNILFTDGHVEMSPTNTAFSLVLTQGVVLLNP